MVYDTETASFSPPYIISLAYVAYENGKRVAKGMIVCNPDCKISEKASAVNGFTNDMVKDKPLFIEEWRKIEKYFNNSIWIGHNTSVFDIRAIKAEATRYGFIVPNHMECDTLKNAKRLIPKDKIKDYKLSTLLDYFNLKVNGDAHNADVDVNMTIKVYNKLVELANGELLIEPPK